MLDANEILSAAFEDCVSGGARAAFGRRILVRASLWLDGVLDPAVDYNTASSSVETCVVYFNL